MVLSDAGAELIGPARRVLRDLDAAKAAVRSTKDLQQGTVHISTMPSPGIEPLTSIIARFAAEHPAIVVRVDGAFRPEDVIDAVRSGAAEIGLLGSSDDYKLAGMRLLPLEDQPLVLMSPPGDELPDTDTVCLADLPGLRLIVSHRGSLMRQLVDDALADNPDVHIAVELAHRTSILPLVLAGVGHAVMPCSWTPFAERSGARVRRIVPVTQLRVSLLHRTDEMTPAASALLASLDATTPPVLPT